ncbi:two-component system NtrC family response regulator/two-component system nitrogen regulation response regulator GlnG [Roseimicrobium gellanilyticum]|uniref:Two-component system NtrC family response regulator/two-component system nitrogen regulation response regulator GlnG n=1 Tax=Roseimicrobium gellanilyticum TaxID=748857 RepID=A0A366HPG0_9BACT|nr:sigma-54 dependent transcriptional regulator [Roseimicrobium gellanilyticum]RBP43865.1 two-component system NtrC family response regulator/two-component system nitrogen regulation response regulator GlnG [Roseimicrobium gellanilyticum]
MHRILIIEDEASVASALAMLTKRLGYEPVTCASGAMGLQKLKPTSPSLVILDIGLPDMSGLDVLARLREHSSTLPVLIITAHGHLQNALDAKKRGASGYLVKPLDLRELEQVLRSLLRPTGEPVVGSPPDVTDAPFLIGSAPAMQPAFTAIAHACASDAPVLITGPTGIGKSLAARVIHRHSSRHAAPFVSLSCASLPDTVLESEIFGHEEGAFPGAGVPRSGHLERAAGGTLFLGEIVEMPLPMQVKLLRFLEEKTFTRMGGHEDIKVDLRIIAATNQDLSLAVAEKRFREDLYYRLRVLEVKLPALWERMSDLPALCGCVLATIAPGRKITLAAEALQVLQGYGWPGNMRELRNALEHAVAVCPGDAILPNHLPREIRDASSGEAFPPSVTLDAALHEWLDARLREPGVNYDTLHDELESRLLAALLPRYQHKPTILARELQMNRATLRKKLRGTHDHLEDEPGEIAPAGKFL